MYANTYLAPPRDLNWLSEAVDNLFSGASGAVHEFPPVNVWTSENTAVVTAELPGVSADAIEINVVGNTLTLKGARPEPALKEDEQYLRRERVRGEFARSLKLPFKIEVSGVTAAFDKGVLTINVPRSEADKPRKIEIKSA